MASEYSFVLCDSLGDALAELTTAAGKQIAFTRNSFAEAQCTISHEDDAAFALWASLRNDGIPQLKVYRDGALIFRGWLAPFQESCEEAALMSLVFRSPLARLFGRFLLPTAPGYTQVDAGQIARNLVDLTGGTGLTTATGILEATKLRDRAYPVGTNVGEAVTNLTELLDGFDLQERFIEGPDLAVLDIFAKLGYDRPDARFEYGPDTLANVRSVARTVTPPINVAHIIGAGGLLGTAVDYGSRNKYGWHGVLQTRSDVSELQTLNDKAMELLRPNPVRVVSFTPDPALAPSPWDAFDLGDTVGFYARRGAFVEDAQARVNGFTVVIDDSGYEAFAIEDPRTPSEEPSIVGAVEVEIVDLPAEVTV